MFAPKDVLKSAFVKTVDCVVTLSVGSVVRTILDGSACGLPQLATPKYSIAMRSLFIV